MTKTVATIGAYTVKRDDANPFRLSVHNKTINVFQVNMLACCGVKEFVSLKNAMSELGAGGIIHQLAEMMHGSARFFNCAFLLFTAVHPDSTYGGGTYGEEFKAFILKNQLGTITESKCLVNPNSSNLVTAYIWEINHEALKAFHGIPPEQPSISVGTAPQIR